MTSSCVLWCQSLVVLPRPPGNCRGPYLHRLFPSSTCCHHFTLGLRGGLVRVWLLQDEGCTELEGCPRYRFLATSVLVYSVLNTARSSWRRDPPSLDKVFRPTSWLHLESSLALSFCKGPGVGGQTALVLASSREASRRLGSWRRLGKSDILLSAALERKRSSRGEKWGGGTRLGEDLAGRGP